MAGDCNESTQGTARHSHTYLKVHALKEDKNPHRGTAQHIC